MSAKKQPTLEELQSLLTRAIREQDSPNIQYSASCRLTELNYYKLGFKPTGGVRVTECIGYDESTEEYLYNHADSIDAPNMHQAYIKVLERKISRKEYAL